MITAEDAETLFWKTVGEVHQSWPVDKPEIGKTQRLKAWVAVIAKIRAHYQDENQRLAQQVRDLQKIIVETVSTDAAAGGLMPSETVTLTGPR